MNVCTNHLLLTFPPLVYHVHNKPPTTRPLSLNYKRSPQLPFEEETTTGQIDILQHPVQAPIRPNQLYPEPFRMVYKIWTMVSDDTVTLLTSASPTRPRVNEVKIRNLKVEIERLKFFSLPFTCRATLPTLTSEDDNPTLFFHNHFLLKTLTAVGIHKNLILASRGGPGPERGKFT